MVFAIMLIWVTAFGILLRSSFSKGVLCADGVYDYRYDKKFCILIFLVPMIIVGFRVEFIDTGSYIRSFNSVPGDIGRFSEQFASRTNSGLFYGLQMIFKCFISDNFQVWIIGLALLQAYLLIHTLKKFSPDLGMSIFLFVSSCLIFNWMCNGIRQFTAVVILFALTEWILENKWYFYLPLIVFIAGFAPITSRIGLGNPPWFLCGVHQSAFLMIPLYFGLQGKAFNKRMFLLSAAVIVIVLSGAADSVLSDAAEYTAYKVDMKYVEADTGTNPIRVLVGSVPMIMALVKYKAIKADKNIPPIIHLCVNASITTSLLYVVSAFTSGIYVGRLPVYTELYNFILLPWLINHEYKQYKGVLMPAMLGGYVLYFIYQCFLVWSPEMYVLAFPF